MTNTKKSSVFQHPASHDTAKLGVVAGTVEISYARVLGIPMARLRIFPDALGALAGVQIGRVDAFAATSLTIQNLVNRADDKNIERAIPFKDPVINGKEIIGYGAFAIRKEDRDLLEALNKSLGEFLGTQTHLELVRPFGFTKNDLPLDVKAGDLCAPGKRSDQKGK